MFFKSRKIIASAAVVVLALTGLFAFDSATASAAAKNPSKVCKNEKIDQNHWAHACVSFIAGESGQAVGVGRVKVFKRTDDGPKLDKDYYVQPNVTSITVDGHTASRKSGWKIQAPIKSESPYKRYDQGDMTSGSLTYSVWKGTTRVLAPVSVKSKTLAAHI